MIKPIAQRDALLRRIHENMLTDKSIFFVSADFGSPVLDDIRADFPDRFLNVGIAEQNLINVSAGLALEGFTVFAYAIAPFITMRCFEQLRVNLALLSEVREMNVNLIGVGAGYSYVVSGPTHQCYEDLSLVRSLPNFRIFSPSDHLTAANLFHACVQLTGPKYLRLDAQVLPPLREDCSPALGKTGFDVLRDGAEIVIAATGFMTHTALAVAEMLMVNGVDVKVIDIVSLTDFDAEAFLGCVDGRRHLFSLEEGFEGRGGVDALMRHLLTNRGNMMPFTGIGVAPEYKFELGSRAELHEMVGIGVNAVQDRILTTLG